jgi:hypothetical protein
MCSTTHLPTHTRTHAHTHCTPTLHLCLCLQVRVCFKRLERDLQAQLLGLDALGTTLALRHLAQLGTADSGCQVNRLGPAATLSLSRMPFA